MQGRTRPTALRILLWLCFDRNRHELAFLPFFLHRLPRRAQAVGLIVRFEAFVEPNQMRPLCSVPREESDDGIWLGGTTAQMAGNGPGSSHLAIQ